MSDDARRMDDWLDSVTAATVRGLIDREIGDYFADAVDRIHAHEGSIWIKPVGQPALVVAYNHGRRPERMEDKVAVPLGEGLVSKCFLERSVVHPLGLFRSPEQSDRVDATLGQLTVNQVAVPFWMFGECCGVLSAVQLCADDNVPARTKWGFESDDVRAFEICAKVLQRLLEYRWIRGDLSHDTTPSRSI